jgi:primary-amine oxidase
VNQGAQEKAGIYMYMVGPLPANKNTTIQPLTFPYNSGRNFVRNPLPNYEDILEWFADVGKEVAELVEDLLGEVVNPGHLKPAPPLMAVSRPAAFNDGTVSAWATVHSPGYRMDSWSLLAQGLYCRFDITGRDSSKWKIYEWFYNGVLYDSTKAFRGAWKSGELKKLPPNRDGKWTEAQPDEKGMPGREKNTPIMIQPDGPRYKVDKEEKFVSWMGWEFYLNAVQSTGLGVWDIKFKGERIIYELGLQEAMAHYAGNDPMSIGMLWLDTLFGMGFNMYELVPGFDCPAYATYLPVSFRQGESTITRNNSICVFEYTADHAIQRHTTPTHVSVSRNSYLIVRTVATVGNYDYTIDYTFYLDGTMEVKVRASGYIFGAYHQLETMRKDFSTYKRESASYDYGYQIHDLVVSSMHDHGLNFKADFDIAGTANTMYRVDVSPFHHRYPWEDIERSTMRLNHQPVEKETSLNWPFNSGAMFVILNNETRNEWGEKRGYRITPGTGMGTPPHLTMKVSLRLSPVRRELSSC